MLKRYSELEVPHRLKLHPKVTDPRTKKLFEHLETDFRKVHGLKYDYSNTVYVSTHEKIEIICPNHGNFEQSAASHKRGVGCPSCAEKNKLKANLLKSQKAKENFAIKAKEVHEGRYDYANAIYLRTHQKVIIICPKHGEFLQSPANHLNGKGCPSCAFESRQKENDRRSNQTAKTFVKNAVKVHGKRYSYDETNYQKATVKVTIICPLHGSFKQFPHNHLSGSGCPKCGRISNSKKLNEAAAKNFVTKVREIHKDKYIYSNVIYSESHIPVEIICPNHGTFKQSPSNHLAGKGCQKCAVENRDLAAAKRSEKAKFEFRDKAHEVHNFKYDYSQCEYKSTREKVFIICPEHGEFEQRPNGHLGGQGCPSCSESGFDPKKPGLLYYLKICGGLAYKIGITNYTVEKRFGSDMAKIDILKTWYFEDGIEAPQKETQVLREFKYAKWTGPKLLIDGNSELFEFDVLGLDFEE